MAKKAVTDLGMFQNYYPCKNLKPKKGVILRDRLEVVKGPDTIDPLEEAS